MFKGKTCFTDQDSDRSFLRDKYVGTKDFADTLY